jgi:hypothetical protein
MGYTIRAPPDDGVPAMIVGMGNTALEFRFTEEEFLALGSNRIAIQIDPHSDDSWAKIFPDKNNGRYIGTIDRRDTHQYRVSIPAKSVPAEVPVFGAVTVSCVIQKGLLLVKRPDTSRGIRHMTPRRSKNNPEMEVILPPDIAKLKEAVGLINDAKKVWGNQLEMRIENGLLRLNMMMEI